MKKEIIKTRRERIIAVCALAICLLAVLLCMLRNRPLDIFVKEPLLPAPWGDKDYMWLRSDRTRFNAEEEIVVEASCGFFQEYNSHYAYDYDLLHIDAACNRYFDMKLSCADLQPFDGDKFLTSDYFGFHFTEDHILYQAKTADFEPEELILKRKGLFRQFTRDSLDYDFTVTLRLKPDAPESFTGSFYLHVFIDEETIPEGSYCEVFIKKDGDRVYLSEKPF